MADLNNTSVNQSNSPTNIPVNASTVGNITRLLPITNKTINERLDKNTTTNLLEYPIDRPKYYMMMKIGEYNRNNLLKFGDLNNVANIVLPLPQTLMDNNGVTYEEQELGQVSGAAYNKVFGSEVKSKSDIEKQIQNQSTGLGYATGQVGLQVLDAATGLNTAGLLSAITGYSPNQFLTILLKGPEYKRHELSWVLTPRNENEAERIRKICNTINNAKAPGITLGGLFFTFPKVFELGFMPNSQYLFKFKPAVLESFVINYAPGGVPAFHRAKPGTNNNNAPVGVELRMRFLELEFWLTGDYTDSNDPFNTRGNKPVEIQTPNQNNISNNTPSIGSPTP